MTRKRRSLTTGGRVRRVLRGGAVAERPADVEGGLVAENESLRFRLGRLQRVSGELAAALTLEQVTEVVMHVVDVLVPSPTRGLWLRSSSDDVLDLVATTTMAAETAERFARIPLDADLPGAVAYRERRTIVSVSRAESETTYEALKGAKRRAEGFVAVPLLSDALCLGVLGLGYDEELTPEDVSFLEVVAGQVAQTILRVQLSEHDRRRRDELEFLADLTEAALTAHDYEDLMRQATSAAVPMLGDWCSLHFLPEDGSAPHVSVAHVDPEKVAWAESLQARFSYDPESAGGIAQVIRSGQTQFVPDMSGPAITDAVEASGRDPDEIGPVIEALGLTSVIAVPLLTRRRTVGAMQFISAESGRRYDEDDVALAEAVAGRLAEALDSAWLADQHRNIAVTLQRALLPPQLPKVPGLDVAARYWPAHGAEVGGDFYDLFALDDGAWAVVIGDACGHGPNAAAVTSIARHTVRAAARHGASHAEIMAWLNEAVLKSDRDLFCTACYATLTPHGGGWVLRTTNAGHPLPIHYSRAGETRAVGQPGTLLGAFPTIRTTTTKTVVVVGDTIVFYTDGVTDLTPPYGLTAEQMAELVHSLRDRDSAAATADAIHASLLARVPEPEHRDDIALVVVRTVPSR